MATKFHQPLRMCVSCRQREVQSKLLRIQCINSNLQRYMKEGRSFYLCKDCLTEEKKIFKVLMRQCKSKEKDKLMNKLKEIITDGRKS